MNWLGLGSGCDFDRGGGRHRTRCGHLGGHNDRSSGAIVPTFGMRSRRAGRRRRRISTHDGQRNLIGLGVGFGLSRGRRGRRGNDPRLGGSRRTHRQPRGSPREGAKSKTPHRQRSADAGQERALSVERRV